ncbi:MAG: hypothetical protein WD425_15945 [Nitrospirales bacterium]
MTQLVNIDECEIEIGYLRIQKQKLIKELSEVVKENGFLREQLLLERRQYRKVLEEARKKSVSSGGSEEDDLCSN